MVLQAEEITETEESPAQYSRPEKPAELARPNVQYQDVTARQWYRRSCRAIIETSLWQVDRYFWTRPGARWATNRALRGWPVDLNWLTVTRWRVTGVAPAYFKR